MMPAWLNDLWLWLGASGDGTFAKMFANDLRDNLFNFGVTLGGFILAAYTFVVIHMKKEVYDTESYKKRFEKHRQNDKKLKLYAPLVRISKSLFWTMVIAFVAAGVQVSVGFVDINWAALLCVLFGIGLVARLIHAIHLFGINIKEWLELIEKDYEQQVGRPV